MRYGQLKLLLILICISSFDVSAQIRVLTWNIQNFGGSKSTSSINFIADVVDDYDLIALQEIVAGPGGAQAVAKLAEELNRGKWKWDYVISDPTSGNTYKSERYAFLWKTSEVNKVGKPWLEIKFAGLIEREPFYCTFRYKEKEFTMVNFHAIPKKQQPETEIKYFKFLHEEYPQKNLVFIGDFNCVPSRSVFNPLRKKGFISALNGQKTTLKTECKFDKCLASEYDNIWFDTTRVSLQNAEIIPFHQQFPTLKTAREISDHVPVTAVLFFL
jgi:endonuclease/exonuclease/phosphatase family metal-dependent hydrolase